MFGKNINQIPTSRNEQIKFPQKIEFSLKSPEDLERVENWLKEIMNEEAAEQCAFVLKSMAEEAFPNHCNEATQAFGKNLAENYGGEESFFELAPDSEFIDARSYNVTKVKRVDFHSVAVIEIKEEEEVHSVIFDLTYHTVSPSENALALYSQGGRAEAMEALKKNYGGTWKSELTLNKKTNTFNFNV